MTDLPLKGLVVIGGEVGVGKTSMALTSGASLERTLYFSWDVKPPGIPLPSENFYDFMSILQAGNELDMAEEVNAAMAKIEPGQYDVIICDAWEHFFSSMIAYIMAHQGDLRYHFFGGGKEKQMQVYGYRKVYESAVLASIQKKVPLVFVINHLDYLYIDSVKTTKKVPKTSQSLVKNASMRVYLQKNKRLEEDGYMHPAPAALVLKDHNRAVYNDELKRWEFPRILPPRMDVRCLPKWREREYISFWDMFYHYLENPVGNRNLVSYETPDELEKSIMHETLTPQEKEAYEAAQRMAMVTQNEALTDAIREFRAAGKNAFEIVRELKSIPELQDQASMGKVQAIIGVIEGA